MTLKEVQVLTEQWMQKYSQIRPHDSLCNRPPARIFMRPAHKILEHVMAIYYNM